MSTLLSAAAAGNGTAVDYTRHSSDPAWIAASGTFDGATAKLQYSYDGSTFIDVEDASFTAAGIIRAYLPSGQVRGVVTGGSSPAVDMELLT